MNKYISSRDRFGYLLFSFLFIIVFSSFATAEDFAQWDAVTISHPIRVDGEIDAALTANITVKNPEGAIIVNFLEMTYNTTTQEHQYIVNAGLNDLTGTYPYCLTATNGTEGTTECFDYEITPSGESGLLGFYFLVIILSYGVLGIGLWKQDITLSVLGSFALYFVGLHILFFGIDVFKNSLTQGFGILTLGVAMYVSARAAHEYITE